MSVEAQNDNVIDIDIDDPVSKESVTSEVKLVNPDEDIDIGEDAKQDDFNEIDLLSEDLPEEDSDQDMDERLEENALDKSEKVQDVEIGDTPASAPNPDFDMDDQNNDTTIYYEALNTTSVESPIDYVSPEKVNDENEDSNELKEPESTVKETDAIIDEADGDHENVTLNDNNADQTQDAPETVFTNANMEDQPASENHTKETQKLKDPDQQLVELHEDGDDQDDDGASKKENIDNTTEDNQQLPHEVSHKTEKSGASEDDLNQEDERQNNEEVDIENTPATENVGKNDTTEDTETSAQQEVEAKAEDHQPVDDTAAAESKDESGTADTELKDDNGQVDTHQHFDDQDLESQQKGTQKANEVVTHETETKEEPKDDLPQQEEPEAIQDHLSSSSSQNVEYCPIPILLQTNVFPYLLCPVSPETHKKSSSELENVITLFDDSSVLQFTLTQILNQVKEIFKENDNPFDEDEELILTFKDFGNTSIEETSILADTLYVYDIIEMFQLVVDNADSEVKSECLCIDLSSRKSFRSQMGKIWALKKQDGEDKSEEDDSHDNFATEQVKRDDTVDFELSEDEPEEEEPKEDGKEETKGSLDENEENEKSATENSVDTTKRSIEALEDDEQTADEPQKRHKEDL